MTGTDSLVLDIGGDVGALVLYADECCLGLEIEVSRPGDPGRTHTSIRRLRTSTGTVVAGVYPALPEGEYTVWGLDGAPTGRAQVAGGRVAEFRGGPLRSRLMEGRPGAVASGA